MSLTCLRLLWDTLRSSYWFTPALMLLGGGALAFALVALDQKIENDSVRGLWWIFGGGAEGARSLLSTVAGSVITVAGTTFSITIAVLSLTSSQFGPRLLRGFLRDTGNQVVLGTFLATFLYCLLVLRTVRSVDRGVFRAAPGRHGRGRACHRERGCAGLLYPARFTLDSGRPDHCKCRA